MHLLDSRGWRLARLFGLHVPPMVTGSDLTAALVRKAAAAKEQVTILGVVQVRVTPKTRNPFTIKALSISGVT